MSDQDLFGYGTGYAPQIDKIVTEVERKVPDVLFDLLMTAVMKDAEAQGVDLNTEDDNATDMLHETVAEIRDAYIAKIREAAASSDPEELYFMLMPF